MDPQTESMDMDLYEVAADWLDRLDELTAQEQAELEAWLSADAEHARVFAVMRRTLLDPALMDAAEAVRFSPAPTTSPAPVMSVWDRIQNWLDTPHAIGAALASVVVLIGLVVFVPGQFTPAPAPEAALSLARYETGVAETLDVVLADASEVTLHGRATVEVVLSDAARQIQLEAGEALFDVAHDPARPFSVHTGEMSVTALGTVFSVDRITDQTVEVRVFEGQVRVAGGSVGERLLSGGQWMLSEAGDVREGALSDGALDSWSTHWLHAERLPLDVILAKINRYTDRPISVSSDDLGQVPVTGSFALDDPEQAAEFLAAMFSADIVETAEGRRMEPVDQP